MSGWLIAATPFAIPAVAGAFLAIFTLGKAAAWVMKGAYRW